MTMILGTVDPNGSVSHTSADINQCRTFLRQQGLECFHTGWANEDDSMRGLICYAGNGEWYSAVFPSDS